MLFQTILLNFYIDFSKNVRFWALEPKKKKKIKNTQVKKKTTQAKKETCRLKKNLVSKKKNGVHIPERVILDKENNFMIEISEKNYVEKPKFIGKDEYLLSSLNLNLKGEDIT